VITVVAAVLAWTRRPFRRDLFSLVLVLPLGVVAQAVLGGFTVLHYRNRCRSPMTRSISCTHGA
jgi:heme A synthase